MKPSCDKNLKHDPEERGSLAADRDILRAIGVTCAGGRWGPPRTRPALAKQSRQAIFAKLKKSPWKLA